jgi:chromosome segregation ATPase
VNEEETREPRTRIGRALDELAQDDSRLARQVEGLREAMTAADARLDLAMRAVMEGAAAPVPTKAGKPLTEKEALSVAKVIEGARRLASERERVIALRVELDARANEHKDLRFQITELKDQLAAVNGAATVDQTLAHDEVHRLSAQIQAKLEAMAPYAARISEYFGQFSEAEAPRPARIPEGAETLDADRP